MRNSMLFWHSIQVMDLVASCRVFVHVSERGSFTLGAAAARVPQSVASRRIAALEEHLGERLFDRSARRAALTAFGRDMLPPAKRLVRLAEEMEYHAERARLRPLSLAVPGTCPVRQLATLDAAVRDKGTVLDIHTAAPGERAELLRSGRVQAALLAVPPDGADWIVPLGAAAPSDAAARSGGSERSGAASPSGGAGPLRLETLRPSRARRAPRRVVIQPEDDVPHVRDPLWHLGNRAGLLPAQIAVATSLIAAVSDTMRTGDYLLCSRPQAAELSLSWRPLAGAPVTRGYSLITATGADAERVRADLEPYVPRILGVPAVAGERA
jgi:DNA-binding transcriptional LysR family regulator